MKIKKRSVINNINIINNFLKAYEIKGITKKENFFFINKEDNLKIKVLLSYAPLSLIERMDYILLKFFFNEELKISESFLELDVTRRTINNDLKKIKKHLKEYNINFLSSTSKGVFLVGKENDIRMLFIKYLAKYLIQKNNCHDLFSQLMNNAFSKVHLKEANELISNLSIKLNVVLPIEYYYNLIALILINFYRKNKKFQLCKEYNTPNYLLENKNYNLLINFFKIYGLKNLELYELDSATRFVMKSYDMLKVA
ncbi:MAG: helix-turn-helix domain-containing protein [Cetobacterium sp.]